MKLYNIFLLSAVTFTILFETLCQSVFLQWFFIVFLLYSQRDQRVRLCRLFHAEDIRVGRLCSVGHTAGLSELCPQPAALHTWSHAAPLTALKGGALCAAQLIDISSHLRVRLKRAMW